MGPTDHRTETTLSLEAALQTAGYAFFPGTQSVRSKVFGGSGGPDYLAVRDDALVIGTLTPTKAPRKADVQSPVHDGGMPDSVIANEGATSDHPIGCVPRAVDHHEIVIRGQIPDHATQMNIAYSVHIPAELQRRIKILKGGYTVPSSETENVERALNNSNIERFEQLDLNNGSTTFIFSIPFFLRPEDLQRPSPATDRNGVPLRPNSQTF